MRLREEQVAKRQLEIEQRAASLQQQVQRDSGESLSDAAVPETSAEEPPAPAPKLSPQERLKQLREEQMQLQRGAKRREEWRKIESTIKRKPRKS